MEKPEYRHTELIKPEAVLELRYMDPSDAHSWEKCSALWNAYQRAFDAFAGPERFRHSVNYNAYHRAGLIGVVNALAEEHHRRVTDLLQAVNEAFPYFWDNKAPKEIIAKIAAAAAKAKEPVAA